MRNLRWILLIVLVTTLGFLSINSFIYNFGYLKEDKDGREYFKQECSQIINEGVLSNLTVINSGFMATFKPTSFFSSQKDLVIFTGLGCNEMKKIEDGNVNFKYCRNLNNEAVNISSSDSLLLDEMMIKPSILEFKNCLIDSVLFING